MKLELTGGDVEEYFEALEGYRDLKEQVRTLQIELIRLGAKQPEPPTYDGVSLRDDMRELLHHGHQLQCKIHLEECAFLPAMRKRWGGK